ncbi:hypothetical protein LTR53_016282 [Teratosphaeriaceae sp. CCFEE 6253]|nr:hypothetical protein LTR53_016282 [Teratosphaeriaceae sp. CCFEE 6253]
MGDSSAADDGLAAAAAKMEDGGMADGTPSSVESTPEAEGQLGAPQDQPAQPVKRKGGRKPIYATSEERKQRNRQAQAAFRERRTEYIKQLEATIKQNEDSLASLQQSHRTAADECLMLRYKNSLLERILLEKGIDVQAELQMKTGSPILGPGFMLPGMTLPQPRPSASAPLQRAAVHQQHARRSGSSFLPKLAPGQATADPSFPQASPGGHPTPSSHSSSPTNVPTRSPSTMHQGGATPPTAAVLAQGQAQQYAGYPRSSLPQPPNSAFYQPAQQQQTSMQQQMQRAQPPPHYQSTTSTISGLSAASHANLNPPMSAGGAVTAGPSSYYPKQEYDAHEPQSMLDHDAEQQQGPQGAATLQGTYPPQFEPQRSQQQLPEQEYYQQQYGGHAMPPPQQQYGESRQRMMPTSQPQARQSAGGPFAVEQSIDPNDPMLDADPFGLSASMHYPTAYGSVVPQSHAR